MSAEFRAAVESTSDDESLPGLADLVDRLTQQVQAGQPVDVEACLRDHPQFADRLRRLLPAVQALAEVGRSVGGSFAALAATAPTDGETCLGDYRILRTLGRGGMGIVYEAVQESLGRHVALKVLPAQNAVDPTYLERFKREAQAAARLHHTNIVPVFGAAEHEGTHFYAMQYIQGRGLDAILRQRRRRLPDPATPPGIALEPLTPATYPDGPLTADPLTAPIPASRSGSTSTSRTASQPDSPARLMELSGRRYFRSVASACVQVAEALDHAHQHGVLHRDIKPSNLLLDEDGVVWIADFGLAKVEGSGELTGSGMVVGTLRYMAPERFRGLSDPRGDVYSLGATLYELLTLRPIFEGDDPLELMRIITNETPAPPRSVERALPRDLETIVLKATDRDITRRYASAGDLAEDLRRFLADQPILARPLPWYERAGRWCRRNPALATALSLALLASLAVAAVSVVFALHRNKAALDLAEENERTQRALAEKEQALAAEREIQRLKELADQRRREFERLSAGLALDRGLGLCGRGQVPEGLLWLSRGLEIYPGGDDELERALRANLTAWAAQLRPLRAHLDHPSPVTALALSPDGRTLLTGTHSQRLRLWDALSGEPLADSFDLSGSQSGGQPAAVFSPDSRLLACRLTGKPEVQLIDARTGKPLGPPLRHTSNVISYVFSPNGARLLVWCTLGQARLWDTVTGKPIGAALRLPGHRAVAARFSDDGARVHIACTMEYRRPQPGQRPPPEAGFELSSWNAATGQADGARQVLAHPAAHFLGFLPDGKTLASAGQDATLRLWQLPDGKPAGEPIKLTDSTSRMMAISPDGGLLVHLHLNTVSVLALPGGKVLAEELPHGLGSVGTASFSPDGKALVVTGTLGTTQSAATVWRLPECTPLCEPFVQEQSNVALAAYHPTRDSLFLVQGQFLNCWGLRAAPDEGVWLEGETTVAFGRGDLAITRSAPGTIHLREARTGRLVAGPLQVDGNLSWAALSDDGSLLAATGTAKMSVFSLNPKNAITIRFTPPDGTDLHRTALSPDGRTVVTTTSTALTFWDTDSGQPRVKPVAFHRGPVVPRFTPDGGTLLLVGVDELHRYDPRTGAALGSPRVFDNLRIFAVSSDGRHVLTFRDKLYETELHDTTTGTSRRLPIVTQMQHAEFSRDGRTLVIASNPIAASGVLIRQWDTASGAALGRSVVVSTVGMTSLSPDGRVALTAPHRHPTATLWHLPTGQPLGPPVRHPPRNQDASFSPDGRLLAGGGQSSHIRPLPVPIEAPVKQVVLWCQVLTGMELGVDGEIGHLDSAAWQQRRRQLGNFPPP